MIVARLALGGSGLGVMLRLTAGFAARCHGAASHSTDNLESVRGLVQQRLRLTPRQYQINQRGDHTHEGSMKDKPRLDVPAHPDGKDERHQGRSDQNRREKRSLTEQIERWKDDGEDEHLRQESCYQDAAPPQLSGFHAAGF